MIAIVNATKAATLFWRLAVLRRQLERARAEIEQLSTKATDDDLVDQLQEARGFIAEAVSYLTPADEHFDSAIDENSVARLVKR